MRGLGIDRVAGIGYGRFAGIAGAYQSHSSPSLAPCTKINPSLLIVLTGLGSNWSCSGSEGNARNPHEVIRGAADQVWPELVRGFYAGFTDHRIRMLAPGQTANEVGRQFQARIDVAGLIVEVDVRADLAVDAPGSTGIGGRLCRAQLASPGDCCASTMS